MAAPLAAIPPALQALGITSLAGAAAYLQGNRETPELSPEASMYGQMASDALFGGPLKAIEWGNGGGVQEGPISGDPKDPMAPTEFPGLSAADFLPSSTTLPPAPPEDPRYTSPMVTDPMSGKYEGSAIQQEQPNLMYAVKDKGGNFKEGAVEKFSRDTLSYSGIYPDAEDRIDALGLAEDNWQHAQAEFEAAKSQLTKSMNDPNADADNLIAMTRLAQDNFEKANQRVILAESNIAIGDWFEKRFPKYVKTDMGTYNDPILKALENPEFKGLSLYDIKPSVSSRLEGDAEESRRRTGQYPFKFENAFTSKYPERSLDVNAPNAAESWERATDAAIFPSSIWRERTIDIANDRESPSWYTNLPEDTPVHEFRYTSEHSLAPIEGRSYLGSDQPLHGVNTMIDGLRISLNPAESGHRDLPTSLHLNKKQLDNMSIAQGMEHGMKVRAWTIASGVKGDRERILYGAETEANKQSLPGYEWKRIGEPRTADMEERYKKQGGKTESYEQELYDALAFEGKCMEHCLDPDSPHSITRPTQQGILNGNIQIFTLRDKKTEKPVVTIQMITKLPEEIAKQIKDRYQDVKPITERKLLESLDINKWMAENPDRLIREIKDAKGFKNMRPKDPLAVKQGQDFLLNGPYSSQIRHIHGPDLAKFDIVDLNILSNGERAKFDRMFPDNNGLYGRQEDVDKIRGQHFATGGYVSNLSAADFLPRN